MTMLPPRAIDQRTLSPTPIMRSPLLSCWSELSERIPKYYKLLILPLFVPREGKQVIIAEYIMYIRHSSEDRAGDDKKRTSLWTSFHYTRRSHASLQLRESTKNPSHHSDHHCTTALRV